MPDSALPRRAGHNPAAKRGPPQPDLHVGMIPDAVCERDGGSLDAAASGSGSNRVARQGRASGPRSSSQAY